MRIDTDVVIISDFTDLGGTGSAIAKEIRALNRAGRRVVLIDPKGFTSRLEIRGRNPKISAAIRSGAAMLAGAGDHVSASITLLENPAFFGRFRGLHSGLSTSWALIVAAHPPYDSRGRLYYDPWALHQKVRSCLGTEPIWAPVANVCREQLHALKFGGRLLRYDWHRIIFVEDWGRERERPHTPQIRMGRHSRPNLAKWPQNRDDIFQIYPNHDDFDVRILGASENLRSLVGDFPRNWTTWEFNKVDVPSFLAEIDFFVYFHHPNWVEAACNCILEAAAAGCVCIVPRYLEATFGDIALYRAPEDVIDTVRAYHRDPEAFARASAIGRKRVDELFGPDAYIAQLDRLENNGLNEVERITTRTSTFQWEMHCRRGAFHVTQTVHRGRKKIKRRFKRSTKNAVRLFRCGQ